MPAKSIGDSSVLRIRRDDRCRLLLRFLRHTRRCQVLLCRRLFRQRGSRRFELLRPEPVGQFHLPQTAAAMPLRQRRATARDRHRPDRTLHLQLGTHDHVRQGIDALGIRRLLLATCKRRDIELQITEQPAGFRQFEHLQNAGHQVQP